MFNGARRPGAPGLSLLLCGLLGCSAGEGGTTPVRTAPPRGTGSPVSASPSPSPVPSAPPQPPSAAPEEPVLRSHLVPGIANATRVARGLARTCVLRGTGEVLCWDDAAPDPTGAPESPKPAEPMAMAGIQDAVELDVFEDHTCVVKASGKLACWGTRVPWPGKGAQEVIPSPREVPGISDATLVATQLGHTCALRRSGKIVCFGEDAFSRLGDPSVKDASGLVTVRGVTDATFVTVSNLGGCAIHGKGALTCWGAGTITAWAPYKPGPSPTASLAPARLKGISDVAAVALWDLRACVIQRTGLSRCWSIESLTMLPDNPLPETSLVANLSDAVATGGELFVRGRGAIVALDADEGAQYSARLLFPEITDAVRVAGDRSRGCAVLATGQVACWGD